MPGSQVLIFIVMGLFIFTVFWLLVTSLIAPLCCFQGCRGMVEFPVSNEVRQGLAGSSRGITVTVLRTNVVALHCPGLLPSPCRDLLGPWLVDEDLVTDRVSGASFCADLSLHGRVWGEVIFYVMRGGLFQAMVCCRALRLALLWLAARTSPR